jgi:hypothetical protein
MEHTVSFESFFGSLLPRVEAGSTARRDSGDSFLCSFPASQGSTAARRDSLVSIGESSFSESSFSECTIASSSPTVKASAGPLVIPIPAYCRMNELSQDMQLPARPSRRASMERTITATESKE